MITAQWSCESSLNMVEEVQHISLQLALRLTFTSFTCLHSHKPVWVCVSERRALTPLCVSACSAPGPPDRAGARLVVGADHQHQRRHPVWRRHVHLLPLHHARENSQGLPDGPGWVANIRDFFCFWGFVFLCILFCCSKDIKTNASASAPPHNKHSAASQPCLCCDFSPTQTLSRSLRPRLIISPISLR